MSEKKFPPNWKEERVREVLSYYEEQSEEEAIAEDEAAYENGLSILMEIPKELVPKIRELIARQED